MKGEDSSKGSWLLTAGIDNGDGSGDRIQSNYAALRSIRQCETGRKVLIIFHTVITDNAKRELKTRRCAVEGQPPGHY